MVTDENFYDATLHNRLRDVQLPETLRHVGEKQQADVPAAGQLTGRGV